MTKYNSAMHATIWRFKQLVFFCYCRHWTPAETETTAIKNRNEGDWTKTGSGTFFPIPETRLKLATVIRTERSATPKQIPTKVIVCSVEAALSRQRKVSESTKDNIKSRIASTTQSTSLHDSSLAKDEQHTQKHE